jgi:hypothetical protein
MTPRLGGIPTEPKNCLESPSLVAGPSILPWLTFAYGSCNGTAATLDCKVVALADGDALTVLISRTRWPNNSGTPLRRRSRLPPKSPQRLKGQTSLLIGENSHAAVSRLGPIVQSPYFWAPWSGETPT